VEQRDQAKHYAEIESDLHDDTYSEETEEAARKKGEAMANYHAKADEYNSGIERTELKESDDDFDAEKEVPEGDVPGDIEINFDSGDPSIQYP